MRKAAVALLAMVVMGSLASIHGQIRNSEPQLALSPRIVAKVALTGLTQPILNSQVFTPQTAGLFRIDAFVETFGLQTCPGAWTPQIEWIADTTVGGSIPFSKSDDCKYGQTLTASFRQGAGFPLTYSVTPMGGDKGTSYSVYITVEQLQ